MDVAYRYDMQPPTIFARLFPLVCYAFGWHEIIVAIYKYVIAQRFAQLYVK